MIELLILMVITPFLYFNTKKYENIYMEKERIRIEERESTDYYKKHNLKNRNNKLKQLLKNNNLKNE